MPLEFFTGFEGCSHTNHCQQLLDFEGGCRYASSNGFENGKCFEHGWAGSYFGKYCSPGTTKVMGFHVKGWGHGATTTANRTVRFLGPDIRFINDPSNSRIIIYRGSTILDYTTPHHLTAANLSHIEIKVVSHATLGSVAIKLDGILVYEEENLNTDGADIIGVSWGSANNFGAFFDNIFISDDWEGELKSHLIELTADDVVEFTRSGGATNYERLLTNDADTNYVESDVVGEQDLYEAGPDLGMFEIHGITFVAVARKTDAGARSLVHAVNYDGVEHDLDAFVLSETYPVLQTQLATYGLDPNGDPWNYLLVNGMNPGFKVA